MRPCFKKPRKWDWRWLLVKSGLCMWCPWVIPTQQLTAVCTPAPRGLDVFWPPLSPALLSAVGSPQLLLCELDETQKLTTRYVLLTKILAPKTGKMIGSSDCFPDNW